MCVCQIQLLKQVSCNINHTIRKINCLYFLSFGRNSSVFTIWAGEHIFLHIAGNYHLNCHNLTVQCTVRDDFIAAKTSLKIKQSV